MRIVFFSVVVAAITVCVSTSSDLKIPNGVEDDQEWGLEHTDPIDIPVTDEQSTDQTDPNRVALAETWNSEDNPEPVETNEEKIIQRRQARLRQNSDPQRWLDHYRTD